MSESQQESPPRFYICPTCFKAARSRIMCHDHLMMPCNAENVEDCQPIMDSDGQLHSRAPRWFLKEIEELKKS